MFDIQAADALLIDATAKLIELRRHGTWMKELPSRCPPILWFGNALSPKRKVLTIAANPSRWEYLDVSCKPVLDKVKENGDESLLTYLEPPKNRFRVLDTATESLNGILTAPKLRAEIIQGYNNYFLECKNPFCQFFGKENGGKVEGFLRGLGASFYPAVNESQVKYQAIHIDLFPFATLSNFKELKLLAVADLFSSGWARQTVAALIHLFNSAPAAVIAFGRANVDCFAKHIDMSVDCLLWTPYPPTKYQYKFGKAQQFDVKWSGLSVNLGDPKGLDKDGLHAFGRHVGTQLGL
jgi:hypothetical protein